MNLGDISKILQQYAGNADQAGAEDDFDSVSSGLPQTEVSRGVAEAFRSDRTPPFPSMVAQMFGSAEPGARANILNHLIAAAGSSILSGALDRNTTGGLSGLGGLLGGVLGGGGAFNQGGFPQVTPDKASQIPSQAVEELARQAQEQDPSIVDRLSDYAAQNPGLVKGLGGIALGIALHHLAKQKR